MVRLDGHFVTTSLGRVVSQMPALWKQVKGVAVIRLPVSSALTFLAEGYLSVDWQVYGSWCEDRPSCFANF